MKYKTKLVFLISLISVCVLILIASFVFDPQNLNTKKSWYVWLNKTMLYHADRIIMNDAAASESIVLIRKNDYWFVRSHQMEYPANQEHVNDLFNLLSQKAAYPVRSTSLLSHERLGVTEQAASRIIVYGGASQIPLLDLLIGSGNDAGNEIYLRKNGINEVRSGADQFTQYSDLNQNTWFDLRLFGKDFPLHTKMIQQLHVVKNNPSESFSYILRREAAGDGTSWKIKASPDIILDDNKTESYLRMLLTSEAADFAVNSVPSDYEFTLGKIELLLDDLSVISFIIAPKTENDQYPAMISGRPFVYLIPEWAAKRILRTAEYFYTS